MSRDYPTTRLAVILAVFLATLYFSAPSLGLAGLFRPFMSTATYEAYRARTLAYGLDLEGGLELVYQVESADPVRIQSAVDVLRNRIDLFGTTNASNQLQAGNQIRIQIPGLEPAKQARIEAVLGSTDLLGLHRVVQESANLLALDPGADQIVLPESVAKDAQGREFRPPSWFLLAKEPALRGDSLADAVIGFDSLTGDPRIRLRMNEAGSGLFARVTEQLVGERLAIVLAGRVYMAPLIEHPIAGGEAEIRGRFDLDEARTVSSILRAGALPAPLTLLARSTVGPTLGADSIHRGLASAALGAAAVLGYLLWSYRLAGFFAGLGQTQNLLLLLTGLLAFDATLTLPGLAGIALGLGMSLDANILVNERIKEEVAAGKPLRTAIAQGFDRAYSAVLDGNLTTLLTCAVLYLLGSGPVKGFAVTLGLGLAASMYSALFVVRALLDAAVAGGKAEAAGLGLSPALTPPPRIGFQRLTRPGSLVSALAVALSLGALASRGLSWGVEYTGGQVYRFRFDDPARATPAALRACLAEPGTVATLGAVTLQPVAETGPGTRPGVEYLVVARDPASLGSTGDPAQALAAGFRRLGGAVLVSSQAVGPSLGREVTRQAAAAMISGSLLVLAYMALRFDLRGGLAAVTALIHDALVVAGVFALFQREVTGDTLAALLTIVGYSVNDTIVVMDRVRENLAIPALRARLGAAGIFELSLNQTLGRTLSTAFVTLIPILALLCLGGPALFDFALAMAIGMVSGTWSTIFVVGALLYGSDSPRPDPARGATLLGDSR